MKMINTTMLTMMKMKVDDKTTITKMAGSMDDVGQDMVKW